MIFELGVARNRYLSWHCDQVPIKSLLPTIPIQPIQISILSCLYMVKQAKFTLDLCKKSGGCTSQRSILRHDGLARRCTRAGGSAGFQFEVNPARRIHLVVQLPKEKP